MSSSSPNLPESGSSQPVRNHPLLDYATPERKSRRSFRHTLVVLDPWIAIAAALPWLWAEFALRIDVASHHHSVMGNDDWSLFAWCWRIADSDWLFYTEVAGSIILIAVACAPSKFRRWVYWIHLPLFAVGYALSWAAWAYLETKLQVVWSCCLPYVDKRPSSIILTLLICNPAATVLLIRLVTPNVNFAGPKGNA